MPNDDLAELLSEVSDNPLLNAPTPIVTTDNRHTSTTENLFTAANEPWFSTTRNPPVLLPAVPAWLRDKIISDKLVSSLTLHCCQKPWRLTLHLVHLISMCKLMCYPLARVCADVFFPARARADLFSSGTCVCWCVICLHMCLLMCYPLAHVCADVLPLACVCADPSRVCTDVLFFSTCVNWCAIPKHVCALMS